MRENLLVIDPDKLAAEGLSPIAAGKAAARMAHLFLEEGVSFARESTLTARFDFTLMAKAKQRGYKIELVYICLASEMLALNIFNTFYGRAGYEGVGQAKAVIFFILVGAIAMIQNRLTRSKEVQQ